MTSPNTKTLNTFRGIFDRAIGRAIKECGLQALKATSLFGSNDTKKVVKSR